MSEPAPASLPGPSPAAAPRRVVSGMRPTGKLHLGHFQGAIRNWIRIVEGGADCFFFSADWHALTTHYKDPGEIRAAEREMFLDWIAAGLDPARCTLFRQSDIKQHAELFLLLGMIARSRVLRAVLQDQFHAPLRAIDDQAPRPGHEHRRTTGPRLRELQRR